MTRDERVIDLLVDVAPAELARRFARSDFCIASTRIGLDVLRYFGVPAKPLPVRVVAMNKIAADWLEALGAADFQARSSDVAAAGGWVVETDVRTGEAGRYAGHLVILAAGHLVDLSLGQFSRPAKDLAVPLAAVFPLGDEDAAARFLADENAVAANMPNGVLLAYRRLTARTYTTSPDWTRKGRYNDLTGRLIRQIRDQLVQTT